MMGVIAVTVPTMDPGGQSAGLVLKVVSMQAFWRVERREGRRLGSSTLTFAVFVWVPRGALG